MKFLEKDLEDIIYETPNIELLNRGLPIAGKKLRQLNIGNYGTADIVTFSIEESYPKDVSLKITIYELKQDFINLNSFIQAIRYTKGINKYLRFRKFKFDWYFDIVLVGKLIDESDWIYLTDLLPSTYIGTYFLSLIKYSYKFDGIYFNQVSGYSLTNNGFKNKKP